MTRDENGHTAWPGAHYTSPRAGRARGTAADGRGLTCYFMAQK